MLLIALTEADSTQNLRSLQIDSAVSSTRGGRVCPWPGDGARRRSRVGA